MSRTIEGNLGSAAARTSRPAPPPTPGRDRFRRRRSLLRRESRALRQRQAAADRRLPSVVPVRGALSVAVRSIRRASAARPDARNGRSTGAILDCQSRRTGQRFDDALSRRRSPPVRVGPDQCGAAAAPHHANAAARPSPSAVKRLPVSNSRTSRRSRRRLWTHASSRPAQQRRPQDGKLLGKRIGHGGRLDPRSAERAGPPPLDEGERHRLGEAGGEQYPPDGAIRRDPVVGRRLRRREHRERGRQTIESVVPPDFFDEVDFARHIDAEARNAHASRRRGRDPSDSTSKPSGVRIRTTSSCGTSMPSTRPIRADPQRDAGVRTGRRIPIDQAADRLAGADLPKRQPRARDAQSAVRRCRRPARSGSMLQSSIRAACSSFERRPGGSTHSRARFSSFPNRFRSGPAHDAADRRGPRRVGDDQHFRIERTVHSVQRRQALARPRAANHQRLAVEPIEIERVHRLADLQHHVVRDVDDVADRPNARRFEALGEPGAATDRSSPRTPARSSAGSSASSSRRTSSRRADVPDGGSARRRAFQAVGADAPRSSRPRARCRDGSGNPGGWR